MNCPNFSPLDLWSIPKRFVHVLDRWWKGSDPPLSILDVLFLGTPLPGLRPLGPTALFGRPSRALPQNKDYKYTPRSPQHPIASWKEMPLQQTQQSSLARNTQNPTKTLQHTICLMRNNLPKIDMT